MSADTKKPAKDAEDHVSLDDVQALLTEFVAAQSEALTEIHELRQQMTDLLALYDDILDKLAEVEVLCGGEEGYEGDDDDAQC